MKSFKTFLSEDILGGYDARFPEKNTRTKKAARTLDELVGKIPVNYTPNETTRTVKLNDDFHVAIDHMPAEDPKDYSYLEARVFSSKPGHEGKSLMTYRLNSLPEKIQHQGRSLEVYSGVPQKFTLNAQRGVFDLPHNFLHTVANTMGVGIMSGSMQSPGGVSMWRKAVQHGQETNHHILRVARLGDTESYPGEKYRSRSDPSYYYYRNYGKVTTRNFSDAYTLDVTKKKTGNKSKVPRGGVNDIRDTEIESRVGNRSDSKLLVLPK